MMAILGVQRRYIRRQENIKKHLKAPICQKHAYFHQIRCSHNYIRHLRGKMRNTKKYVETT